VATATGKPAKKEKVKPQTAEERLESLRYNHMMYGPTAGEFRPVAKKIDFGAVYIKHPKFQSLITAFRKESNHQFTVTDKGKSHVISTDGTHICFNDKVIFYSRALNKFERNLLLDKLGLQQFQMIDSFVHLVFAVIRSFPEIEATQLRYASNEFYFGSENLSAGVIEQGPNFMIGAYKIHVAKAK
jgi:hypothetical protein